MAKRYDDSGCVETGQPQILCGCPYLTYASVSLRGAGGDTGAGGATGAARPGGGVVAAGGAGGAGGSGINIPLNSGAFMLTVNSLC